ncbi:hypothetical protein FQZ97_996430 [compost metagenome]
MSVAVSSSNFNSGKRSFSRAKNHSWSPFVSVWCVQSFQSVTPGTCLRVFSMPSMIFCLRVAPKSCPFASSYHLHCQPIQRGGAPRSQDSVS